MILDKPPPDFRPDIPASVKVALLRQMLARLGFPVVHFDHRPPISERPYDTEKRNTIPPANDLEHLEAITPEEHDRRTNGPGGEKRITTAGSDTHRRAKHKRIKEKGFPKMDGLRQMRARQS